jgi:hypothetical protein
LSTSTSDDIDTSGHDSFLDVVANLVGILLILIMVIGVRTRHAWKTLAMDGVMNTAGAVSGEAPPVPANASLEEQKQFTKAAELQLQRLKESTFKLEEEARGISEKVAERRTEQATLQLAVSAAEKGLELARGQFDSTTQQTLEGARAVESLRAEYAQLEAERDAANALAGNPKVIDHYPTPMAETVFGREDHYRLQGGRLTHVPMEEFLLDLRKDAQNKLWKLKHVNEVTEVLPAREGFRLRYTLHRQERREETDNGVVLKKSIELAQFVLVPEADDLGVSVTDALREGSEFRSRLQRLSPQETTITIWTYPDSFSEFRQIKEFLQSQGFLTAGRPLPEGLPIGGSPDGQDSAAE